MKPARCNDAPMTVIKVLASMTVIAASLMQKCWIQVPEDYSNRMRAKGDINDAPMTVIGSLGVGSSTGGLR